jgi:hypothetical protein
LPAVRGRSPTATAPDRGSPTTRRSNTEANRAERRGPAGRPLTMVIKQTVEPSAWLIVTGWYAAQAERRFLPSWRARQREALPFPSPATSDCALVTIDPRHVELHDGSPSAGVRITVSVEGKDAKRLARLRRG